MKKIKTYNLAILQRVIPSYREFLFEGIGNLSNINLKVFYGSDVPNTKIKSSFSKIDINTCKLKTITIKIFNRYLLFHQNLLPSLVRFKPDIIIAEGESNILSYLQALIYKFLYKKIKVIHWSLGAIPNKKNNSFFLKFIKSNLIKLFDGYIVYSTFGKEQLIKTYKVSPNKIFVALNISNIDRIINYKFSNDFNKSININNFNKDNFTIITSGNLEKSKNFELILDAFKELPNHKYNLIFLGEGENKNNLKKIAKKNKLHNAYFLGHVDWKMLVKYYSISDLFILPGRGGMVISESMACGLPVLLKDADGIELDLIRDNITGYYFYENNPLKLANRILEISENKKLLKKVSINGFKLIKENYSNKKFISEFKKAIIKTLND